MHKRVLWFILFLAFVSINAIADWSGNARVRYRTWQFDDQLNSANANGDDMSVQNRRNYEYRASLKYDQKLNQNWAGEVGLRTTGSPTSFYTTVNNSADRTLGLELANAKWASGDSRVQLGRQKILFEYDQIMQNAWDNDLRLDGLGASYGREALSVAAGMYVFGAVNQGTFGGSEFTKTAASEAAGNAPRGIAYLFGVQPSWTFEMESMTLTLALARYHWIRATGFANRVHGGHNSQTLNPAADTGTVNIHNPRQWHALIKGELPKLDLRASLEWLRNKELRYGNGEPMDRAAWSATLSYRKVRKQWDWSATYGYTSKGLAVVPAAVSNGDILPDAKAHVVDLTLMPADRLTVTATGYFSREKSRRTSTGQQITTSQEQKARALYFTAGVSF